jgi:hypothetical protein
MLEKIKKNRPGNRPLTVGEKQPCCDCLCVSTSVSSAKYPML